MLDTPNPHEKEYFGQELVMNLYDCDIKKISDGKSIAHYAITLCDDVIAMKRYGEPQVPYFGEESPITAGYSLVQLIETSSITGHFSEHKKSCYINIFSCKWFDMDKAAVFTKQYFGAKRIQTTFLKRE